MLATLAIHAEAWLQEELGAQRALLAALERVEQAARHGQSVELEACGRELPELLAGVGARDARRQALLARLAAALQVPAGELALSNLAARLAPAGIAVQRLEGLRVELRETIASVLKTSRRLSALARYHSGLLTELCSLLAQDAPAASDGHLVDAHA